MARTFEHALIDPFTYRRKVGGQDTDVSVDTVTLSIPDRLTAGFMRCTDGHDGEMAKAIAMIARCSDLPVAACNELGLEDMEVLVSEITKKSTPGPPTSGMSSET